MFWVVESMQLGVGSAAVRWVLRLLAGSVDCSPASTSDCRRSMLLVALSHAAFNFTSATTATQGLSETIALKHVIVAAVVVLVRARTASRRPGVSSRADAPSRRGAVDAEN